MRTGWVGVWLCQLLLGWSACRSAGVYNYAAEPDPRSRPYVLGVSDRIRIGVWRNTELSTDAVIRPDGTITLPLLGDLAAAGLTTPELRDRIIQRLRRYITGDAVVTIALIDVNSYRFTVSGNVFHGGAFSPGRYVTVMEAIAMAGGLTRFAEANSIIINRTDRRGTVRRIPIDYEKIASGKAPEQNLAILPGDTVYVP